MDTVKSRQPANRNC